MGMFDYLRCERELPVPGFAGREFQTKDTPAQYMDTYTIRADGTLVGEDYEIEDRSDPNADGFMALIGCATRVNVRPSEPIDFTGEICFYAPHVDGDWSSWIEFSSYFIDGKLQSIVCTRNEPPAA